jgi:hypothetical protein
MITPHHYNAGDLVIIDKSKYGREEPHGRAEILAQLPMVKNSIFYRVRFDGERFERNIAESAISSLEHAHITPTKAVVSTPGSSWVNMSRIHTKK